MICGGVRWYSEVVFPMKKFLIWLGILVVSIVCITVFKNLVIKTVVTVAASRITGAPVHMDGFSLNILSSTIHISGFKIYNPSGFPKGLLVSCPKIKVIYDRATLFSRKRHFLIVEIELGEVRLTRNKEGILNVDSLKIAQQSKDFVPIPMRINLLTLNVGKLVYNDCAIGSQEGIRAYLLNKHKSYKGILTAQQLAVLVFAESIKITAINNAGICGLPLVKGVAALPDAVAETFIGKDSVRQIINAGFEHVYEISLQEIKRIGTITKLDEPSGVIKANINEAIITLILKKGEGNKIEITISARKYMLPQLDIAAWVLYQIIDTLHDTLQ
jgi:hypothetical protein